MTLLKELWLFLRVRKKLWLLPFIITLHLLGALLIFTHLYLVVRLGISAVPERKEP